MNGAESLVRTLIGAGVEVCFTNPGTSEMHIVAALDQQPSMHTVLGLFEGVVTAAADGYARMAGKPACTLLHLGPGLGNGVANLHNARRAQVPILNIVGQHATYHLRYDTPLTSDIEGIAWPCSKWVRTSCGASQVGLDATDAIVAARTAPAGIATLIVPADAAWNEGGGVIALPTLPRPSMPPNERIERAAAMLRSGFRTGIFMSGSSLYGRGLAAAGRIAASTGAHLLAPYPFPRMERGGGSPKVERTNYVLEQAIDQFKEFRQLLLVGAAVPMSYFAAPGKTSIFTPADCEISTLATSKEDCAGALEALAELFPPHNVPVSGKVERPRLPVGPISLPALAAAVAALLPEHAVVVDESMTSGRTMMAATRDCPSHEWLANTGGSIGVALPLAVGAAVACPERRVLCLSADGSAMYTAQALWTMAREGLKIITVIFANRAYAVLQREFSYLGIGDPGRRARDLFEIDRPAIDWVSLSRGMGVPARRVSSMEDFVKAFREGFENDGPALIEVPL